MALTVTAPTTGPTTFSWGPFAAERVIATPAASDYVAGGYAITPGQGVAMGTVLWVMPIGGQGGFVPVWNPTTLLLQMFQQSAATGALTECTASENLSAQAFNLLLAGY